MQVRETGKDRSVGEFTRFHSLSIHLNEVCVSSCKLPNRKHVTITQCGRPMRMILYVESLKLQIGKVLEGCFFNLVFKCAAIKSILQKRGKKSNKLLEN